MNTETTTATAHRHTYASGRPFWVVTCSSCQQVMNSGHHYLAALDAELAAADHNHAHHPGA